MVLLLGNIILYSLSEEYRFFLKKVKYQEEVVYDSVDANDNQVRGVGLWDSSSGGNTRLNVSTGNGENFTFLDTLVAGTKDSNEEELPQMTLTETEFVQAFSPFNLKQLETHTNIFGVTTEYPDPYYEWYSAGVSIYILSTKSYSEVKSIFETLAFELPYSLNTVNNFWDRSFYINLDDVTQDNYVRIVMEYENRVFWLKIRKDRYNESKWILDQL